MTLQTQSHVSNEVNNPQNYVYWFFTFKIFKCNSIINMQTNQYLIFAL